MRLRVGIENNNDGRSIGWALEHPGCFCYGRDADEARTNMAQAAQDYAAWVQQHGLSWMGAPSLEVDIEETFDAYRIPRAAALAPGQKETYLVESFFRHDAEPLSDTEIERALKTLAWSREDLLSAIRGLSHDKLNQRYEGERWSINGILKHVSGAEWWYQERLGAPFPPREEELPEDPLESLELVREHFLTWLPRQEGVRQVVELEGETWSPRKVLRRALWHERDHTGHIGKLL